MGLLKGLWMTLTLDEAVAKFGKAAKDKLNNPGATGQAEDQLRAPLEFFREDPFNLRFAPETARQLYEEALPKKAQETRTSVRRASRSSAR